MRYWTKTSLRQPPREDIAVVVCSKCGAFAFRIKISTLGLDEKNANNKFVKTERIRELECIPCGEVIYTVVLN